jgi:hypothetical protein
VAICCWICSGVNSSRKPALKSPALLTRRSMRPKRSTAVNDERFLSLDIDEA